MNICGREYRLKFDGDVAGGCFKIHDVRRDMAKKKKKGGKKAPVAVETCSGCVLCTRPHWAQIPV